MFIGPPQDREARLGIDWASSGQTRHVMRRLLPLGSYSIVNFYLEILVYLVIYDSG